MHRSSATDEAANEPDLRVSVAGDDADAAIAALAGLYAGKTWYSCRTDEPYAFRYVGVGDAAMSIRRSQMSGYLRGDVATEGEVVVQWIDSGTARVDVGVDEVRMDPGRPTLFPLDRRFQMEYQDWDQRLVHLSRDLVLDVAAERPGFDVEQSLDLDHTSTPSPAAVVRWRMAVAQATHVLRVEGTHSLAWHEATREAARALLEMYPPHTTEYPRALAEPRNARLRAVIDHMQAHLDEPLTVGGLAAIAGVSPRALQQSFQRTVGQTPMHYLRDARLGRARADLLRSDPASTNVNAIGRRWGFTHMGRFSADYARRFGEYPSETLRR